MPIQGVRTESWNPRTQNEGARQSFFARCFRGINNSDSVAGPSSASRVPSSVRRQTMSQRDMVAATFSQHGTANLRDRFGICEGDLCLRPMAVSGGDGLWADAHASGLRHALNVGGGQGMPEELLAGLANEPAGIDLTTVGHVLQAADKRIAEEQAVDTTAIKNALKTVVRRLQAPNLPGTARGTYTGTRPTEKLVNAMGKLRTETEKLISKMGGVDSVLQDIAATQVHDRLLQKISERFPKAFGEDGEWLGMEDETGYTYTPTDFLNREAVDILQRMSDSQNSLNAFAQLQGKAQELLKLSDLILRLDDGPEDPPTPTRAPSPGIGPGKPEPGANQNWNWNKGGEGGSVTIAPGAFQSSGASEAAMLKALEVIDRMNERENAAFSDALQAIYNLGVANGARRDIHGQGDAPATLDASDQTGILKFDDLNDVVGSDTAIGSREDLLGSEAESELNPSEWPAEDARVNRGWIQGLDTEKPFRIPRPRLRQAADFDGGRGPTDSVANRRDSAFEDERELGEPNSNWTPKTTEAYRKFYFNDAPGDRFGRDRSNDNRNVSLEGVHSNARQNVDDLSEPDLDVSHIRVDPDLMNLNFAGSRGARLDSDRGNDNRDIGADDANSGDIGKSGKDVLFPPRLSHRLDGDDRQRSDGNMDNRLGASGIGRPLLDDAVKTELEGGPGLWRGQAESRDPSYRSNLDRRADETMARDNENVVMSDQPSADDLNGRRSSGYTRTGDGRALSGTESSSPFVRTSGRGQDLFNQGDRVLSANSGSGLPSELEQTFESLRQQRVGEDQGRWQQFDKRNLLNYGGRIVTRSDPGWKNKGRPFVGTTGIGRNFFDRVPEPAETVVGQSSVTQDGKAIFAGARSGTLTATTGIGTNPIDNQARNEFKNIYPQFINASTLRSSTTVESSQGRSDGVESSVVRKSLSDSMYAKFNPRSKETHVPFWQDDETR